MLNSLKLGEKSIIGLPMNKVIENEALDEALEGLKNKPKNATIEELRVKSGDSGYKTKVDIIPIISTDVDLMETMIVFHYIQKKRL